MNHSERERQRERERERSEGSKRVVCLYFHYYCVSFVCVIVQITVLQSYIESLRERERERERERGERGVRELFACTFINTVFHLYV